MTKLAGLLMAFAVLFSCNKTAEKATSKASHNYEKIQAVIKTTHGNIRIKFFPKDAPNTVKRIVELIDQGFYNGLKFHRVVPNFVIQGGDPTGKGIGGSGKKLKAEFSSQKHVMGTVAMARSAHIDSADSQFYISMNILPHLDGKYTVFGKVVDESDLVVVRKVKQNDKMLSVYIEK